MNDKIIAGYDDIKLELWLRNREKNKIVWKTKNGNLISIKEISDEHLENIINHLESTDVALVDATRHGRNEEDEYDYYDNGALMPEGENSRDLMMVLDTPAKMSENSTKASGKKPLYYIRGVKDRGKEVLNELIKLGGTSDAYVFGDTENLYYLINSCNYIISTPVISDLADILLGYGVELYLPEPKYKFTVGEKVLYRFDDSQWWKAGRFVCVAINGFVVEKRKDKNGTYS